MTHLMTDLRTVTWYISAALQGIVCGGIIPCLATHYKQSIDISCESGIPCNVTCAELSLFVPRVYHLVSQRVARLPEVHEPPLVLKCDVSALCAVPFGCLMYVFAVVTRVLRRNRSVTTIVSVPELVWTQDEHMAMGLMDKIGKPGGLGWPGTMRIGTGAQLLGTLVGNTPLIS